MLQIISSSTGVFTVRFASKTARLKTEGLPIQSRNAMILIAINYIYIIAEPLKTYTFVFEINMK